MEGRSASAQADLRGEEQPLIDGTRRRALVRLLAEAYCIRLERLNGSKTERTGDTEPMGLPNERSELLPTIARE